MYVCTHIIVHNCSSTKQFWNFPSYPDSHRCSDVVYWTAEGWEIGHVQFWQGWQTTQTATNTECQTNYQKNTFWSAHEMTEMGVWLTADLTTCLLARRKTYTYRQNNNTVSYSPTTVEMCGQWVRIPHNTQLFTSWTRLCRQSTALTAWTKDNAPTTTLKLAAVN